MAQPERREQFSDPLSYLRNLWAEGSPLTDAPPAPDEAEPPPPFVGPPEPAGSPEPQRTDLDDDQKAHRRELFGGLFGGLGEVLIDRVPGMESVESIATAMGATLRNDPAPVDPDRKFFTRVLGEVTEDPAPGKDAVPALSAAWIARGGSPEEKIARRSYVEQVVGDPETAWAPGTLSEAELAIAPLTEDPALDKRLRQMMERRQTAFTEGLKSRVPLTAHMIQKLFPGDSAGSYRLSVLLPQLAGLGKEEIVFDYKKAWEDPGKLPGMVAWGAGHTIPSLAQQVGGRLVGAAAGIPLGPAGMAVGQQAGSIGSLIPQSVDEAKRTAAGRQGFRETEDVGRIYAAAAASAVMESFLPGAGLLRGKTGWMANKIGKLMRRGRVAEAGKMAREVALKSQEGSAALKYAAELSKDGLIEFGTEFAGELTRQGAAASATGTPLGEGLADSINEGFMAALVGLPMSSVSTVRDRAQQRKFLKTGNKVREAARPVLDAVEREVAAADDISRPFDGERLLKAHESLEDLDAQAAPLGGIGGANEQGAYFDLGGAQTAEERIDQIVRTRRERQRAEALRAESEEEFQAAAERIDPFKPLSPAGQEQAQAEATLDEQFWEKAMKLPFAGPRTVTGWALAEARARQDLEGAVRTATAEAEQVESGTVDEIVDETAAAAVETAQPRQPDEASRPMGKPSETAEETGAAWERIRAERDAEFDAALAQRAEQEGAQEAEPQPPPPTEVAPAQPSEPPGPPEAAPEPEPPAPAEAAPAPEPEPAPPSPAKKPKKPPKKPKGAVPRKMEAKPKPAPPENVAQKPEPTAAEPKRSEQPIAWKNAPNDANLNSVLGVLEDMDRAESAGEPIATGEEFVALKQKVAARRDQLKEAAKGRNPKTDQPEESWDLPEGNDRKVVVSSDFDPENRGRVGVRYAVLPRAELRHSQEEGYDKGVQPRTVTAKTLESVDEIASKFDPLLISESNSAQEGGPIVAPFTTGGRRDVEVGNHRLMGLDRLNEKQKAEYREHLEDLGYDLSGIEDPILVRVRTSGPWDAKKRKQFLDKANDPKTQTKTKGDRSREIKGFVREYLDQRAQDSKTAGGAPDLYQLLGGSIVGNESDSGDYGFLNELTQQLGAMERGAMWIANPNRGKRTGTGFADSKDRIPTKELRDLATRVLLREAYDSDELVSILMDTSKGTKTFTGALLDAAPRIIKLKAEAERGSIPARYAIMPDIAAVAKKVAATKGDSSALYSVIDAPGLLSSNTRMPVEKAVWFAMVNPDDKTWSAKLRPATEIRKNLVAFANRALQMKDEGAALRQAGAMAMFAPKKQPEVEELFYRVVKERALGGNSLGLGVSERRRMADAGFVDDRTEGMPPVARPSQPANLDETLRGLQEEAERIMRTAPPDVRRLFQRADKTFGAYESDSHSVLIAAAALAAPDSGRATLMHELVHALRAQGFISQSEWDAMLDIVTPDQINTVTAAYPGLDFDRRFEEAVAELFANYATAAENRKQSQVELFEDILAGKVGAREMPTGGAASKLGATPRRRIQKIMLRLGAFLGFVRQAIGKMADGSLAALGAIWKRTRAEFARKPGPMETTMRRSQRLAEEWQQDTAGGRADNVTPAGKPLTGNVEVDVMPGGTVYLGDQQVTGSIGIRASTLPNPDRTVRFSGEAVKELPLATRWRVERFAFGAEDDKSLPWFRPALLSAKHRAQVRQHTLDRTPLPAKLAAAVRAAEPTAKFDFLSIRDGNVWAHRTAKDAEEVVTEAGYSDEVGAGEVLANPHVTKVLGDQLRSLAERVTKPKQEEGDRAPVHEKGDPSADPNNSLRFAIHEVTRPQFVFKNKAAMLRAVEENRIAHDESTGAEAHMRGKFEPLRKRLGKFSAKEKGILGLLMNHYDEEGFWPSVEEAEAEAKKRGLAGGGRVVRDVHKFLSEDVGGVIRDEERRNRGASRQYLRWLVKEIGATPAERKELEAYAKVVTKMRQAEIDWRVQEGRRVRAARRAGEETDYQPWAGYTYSDKAEKKAYGRGRSLLRAWSQRTAHGAEMSAWFDRMAGALARVDVTSMREGYFPHRFYGQWRAFRVLTRPDGSREVEALGAIPGEVGGFDDRDSAMAAVQKDWQENLDAEYVVQSRRFVKDPAADGWLFEGTPGQARTLRNMVLAIIERSAKDASKASGGVVIKGADLKRATKSAADMAGLFKRIRGESEKNTLAAARSRRGTKGWATDVEQVLEDHYIDVARWLERNRIQRAATWAMHREGASLSEPNKRDSAAVRAFRLYTNDNLGKPGRINQMLDEQYFGGGWLNWAGIKPGTTLDLAIKAGLMRAVFVGLPAAMVLNPLGVPLMTAMAVSGGIGFGMGVGTKLRRSTSGSESQRLAGTEGTLQALLKLSPLPSHVGYAMTNMTQMFFTTPAVVGPRLWAKGAKDYAAYLSRAMPAKEREELRAEMERVGIGADPMNKVGDVLERSRFSHGMAEYLKSFMFFGTATEWSNRAQAFMAGRRLGQKMGLKRAADLRQQIAALEKAGEFEKAEDLSLQLGDPTKTVEALAAQVVARSQFDYTAASRPGLLRKRLPHLSDAVQFKNYLAQIIPLYLDAVTGDQPMFGADTTKPRTLRNRAMATSWMLGMGTLIAGSASMPIGVGMRLVYEAMETWDRLMDDEDEKEPVDAKLQMWHDRLARAEDENTPWPWRVIDAGLPERAGIAMGGRAGMQDILPVPGGLDPLRTSPDDLLGPGGQGDVELLRAMVAEPNTLRVMERWWGSMAPGQMSPFQAARSLKTGREFTSRGRETGRATDPTEAMIQFFGLTGRQGAYRGDTYGYEKALTDDRDRFSTKWRIEFRKALANKNRSEQRRLQRVLNSYGRMGRNDPRVPFANTQSVIEGEYERANMKPWLLQQKNRPEKLRRSRILSPGARAH